MAATDPTRSVLRVIRGSPDGAELAALVVALAVALAPGLPPARARSPWADQSFRQGAFQRSGPDAWRISGLPR
ncbi:acyl-CoA carboxylase epsilon subunit [Amycolatopsis sp. NPDC051371]|uniref:acyl-CoA carboxylase epsilon subunit n=1 Tax=Amycolatopsis sp. NPDC051371 TaxID=3155800 RepID=UPI00342DB848